MSYKIDYDLEKKITVQQSYEALYAFFEGYFELTDSDLVANFLGSLSTIDGVAMDRALQEDYLKAVEKAINGEVDTRLMLVKE